MPCLAKKSEGRVTAINPLVEEATRNIRIQATVDNRQERLRPGMFVDVDVIMPEREDVRMIPTTAVLYAPYSDSVFIHDIIFDELCRGKLLGSSRKHYLRIVDQLAAAGAEAVILGCTEIGMLIKQEDTTVRLYDTTAIHAAKAVSYALENL